MGSFNALAYARMIAHPLIDATRTAVLGHSEGTWLTPALPNRFPQIQALVLISTGLGVMHALSFTQVTLPCWSSRPMIPTTTAPSLRMKCPSPTPSPWGAFRSVFACRGSSSCCV
jgi:pimeloyl-ACP methyl ester carboxylesterase